RGDQEVLVPFPLQHRCKQFYECRPADRSLEIEPGPVGRDPHVEIAAERRIPQVYGRQPFLRRLALRRFAYGAGNGVEPSRWRLPFLRHGFPGTFSREWPFSTRS